MYKRDTRDIGKLFEKTLMAKYGPSEVGDHWMAFDTICDATQERQVCMSGHLLNFVVLFRHVTCCCVCFLAGVRGCVCGRARVLSCC